MGKQQDRADAVTTLVAASRAQTAAVALGVTAMASVAVNTISSQNITDVNAALTAANAIITAVGAANASLRAAE